MFHLPNWCNSQGLFFSGVLDFSNYQYSDFCRSPKMIVLFVELVRFLSML